MPTSKKGFKITVIDLLIIILGGFLTAFSFNKLIIPAGLLSGGLTGISQIINHFTSINLGVLYFAFNVPLLILGYIQLGKRFSLYTIFSTSVLSTFLYLIPIGEIWTDDILISAIFGGIFASSGAGLVLRRGGSQGGLDILSRVIAKYKNITVGKTNLLINIIIMIISGFIFGSEIVLYTIILIFMSMKTYEVILNHVNHVSLLIITDKGEDVSRAINKELHRGTTSWNGNGGYTHLEKTILFCVIMEGELAQLKKIVKTEDPKSFVSVISTQSVVGRFHQIW